MAVFKKVYHMVMLISFRFHSLHLVFTALIQALPTARAFLLASLPLIYPSSLVILQTAPNPIISHHKSHPVLLLVLFWFTESSPKPMVFGRSFQWVFSGPPPQFPSFPVPNETLFLWWMDAELQPHWPIHFPHFYQVAFFAFKIVFISFLGCPFPHFSNWHIVGEVNIW